MHPSSLLQEIARRGDRAALLPVDRLQDIRQDLDALRRSETLNEFQQFILDRLYMLDVPDTGFPARSILIVASPGPAIIELSFDYGGRKIPVQLPAGYVEKETAPRRIAAYLEEFLDPQGYHIYYTPQLPRKRLAVRSELAAYGRNNITYVEGMGSFLVYAPFFTDLPCSPDAPWQEARHLARCTACQACLQNCPTGAILPGRFLIDNERCLPYFNEGGGWEFPEWIDPSAHNALVGCLRCQTVCPENQAHLKTAPGPVEFSAAETALLLEGRAYDLLPEGLRRKIGALEMGMYLEGLPRNLRALFSRW